MRGLGYLLIVATAVMWATNGPMAQLAFRAGIEPTDLAAMRVIGSALLFGVGAALALRRLTRREILLVAAFGVLGIMAAQYLYYEALDRIDVSVALVIIYMNPLVIAAYQRVRHGELLPGRALWAMPLAFAGVVLMVVGRDGGLGAISTAGLLLAIGTMIAATVQIILAGRLPRTLTPTQRTGGGMMAAAAVWLVIDPIWTIPWSSLADPASLGVHTDAQVPVIVLVLWITVVGTALPYVTLVSGAARIGAGATSMVTMIEPVIGSLLAWVMLGQALAPLQVAGGAIALLAVALVEQARMRMAPTVPAG